jgi:hypothetical protein
MGPTWRKWAGQSQTVRQTVCPAVRAHVEQDVDSMLEPTKNFIDYYLEEIKEQIRGDPPQKKP